MGSVRLARVLELQAGNISDSGGGGGVVLYQLPPALFPSLGMCLSKIKDQRSCLFTLLPKIFGLEKLSGNGMSSLVIALKGMVLVSDFSIQSILWF